MKIIGSIATVEWRSETLADIVRRVCPHVDELHVYLDRWSYWPIIEGVTNVVFHASEEVVGVSYDWELANFGKYVYWDSEPHVRVQIDDDTLVCDCLIPRLVEAVEYYGTLVAATASIRSTASGRLVTQLASSGSRDSCGNFCGMSCAAWPSHVVPLVAPRKMPGHPSDDVWVARTMQELRLPIIRLAGAKAQRSFTSLAHDPRSSQAAYASGARPSRQDEIARHEWSLFDSPVPLRRSPSRRHGGCCGGGRNRSIRL